MASANVELVRRIWADWERGDFSASWWADPEIEFVFGFEIFGQRGTAKGLAGMAQAWREWLSSWQEFRSIAEEYRELDDERVLVLNDFGGSGKVSGLTFDQMRAEGAALFHVRRGKVTRIVLYGSRAEALAAHGLT